ncbi:hypothetical protein BC939DRAFT_434200 [Gamsiella multidivaricata]|uniref:uncharacterized protein n=1 Tax=Gamsiella multidivaricata TaxID=101098 RepID=UPI00221F4A2D|nr:uncharacterized protein BC939DRAFT_434200 [Gamsiella multidivaricata]KAI7832733.1 hypothetical protein BC939DRAFT_434200 [Gamsiella multidivaricata]
MSTSIDVSSGSMEGKEESPAQKHLKFFKGSQLPPLISNGPPHVLISGAGLAGLFLANLLERANIPYQLFERAKEVLPLGSIMCLTANILPVFEQLGLYDDLMKVSHPSLSTKILSADLKKIGEFNAENDIEVTGYHRALFSRPELYKILLSRIPPHKIHMSKKVMSFLQNKDGVMVRLQDGSTVHGDILVGADGAHSAVRQTLYQEMEKQGKLPQCDTRRMMKGYICMVGTTGPLDPAKYPGVDVPASDGTLLIGNSSSPYAWSMFSVPGNKMCWNVVLQLDVDASEDEQFRNSEWSSITNKRMIEEVYHFKTPYGIMGDLIDATPSEQISRVFLEDILYETWHHMRTVLIGDAAHKLLPSTGQGAVNAMQDAVVLANCLYDLTPLSIDGIKTALKDYREQRFAHVKTQYEASQMGAKLQYGHTWQERILRHFVFNYMPKSVQRNHILKDSQYRPQAMFLPPAPKRGSGPVLAQKPSKRYAEKQTMSGSTMVV